MFCYISLLVFMFTDPVKNDTHILSFQSTRKWLVVKFVMDIHITFYYTSNPTLLCVGYVLIITCKQVCMLQHNKLVNMITLTPAISMVAVPLNVCVLKWAFNSDHYCCLHDCRLFNLLKCPQRHNFHSTLFISHFSCMYMSWINVICIISMLCVWKQVCMHICWRVLIVTCLCDVGELSDSPCWCWKAVLSGLENSSCQPCLMKCRTERWSLRQLSMGCMGMGAERGLSIKLSIYWIYLQNVFVLVSLSLFFSRGAARLLHVSSEIFTVCAGSLMSRSDTSKPSPPSFSFPLRCRHFTSQLPWSAIQQCTVCSVQPWWKETHCTLPLHFIPEKMGC